MTARVRTHSHAFSQTPCSGWSACHSVPHSFTGKRQQRPRYCRHRSGVCAAAEQDSEGRPDFIERWYGKILGKQALEDRNPFGMKRLGADEVRV